MSKEATNIVRLDSFKRGVRCTSLGLYFPVVYRLTGASWKQHGKTVVPDRRYRHTEYTLSDEATTLLAEATFAPIDYLDPALDDGWVIVRHHASRMHVDGYLDGMQDFEQQRHVSRVVYQNDTGLFTIGRRPAMAGCANYLLVYGATIPSSSRYASTECWQHIISSNGEIASEDALYSPE